MLVWSSLIAPTRRRAMLGGGAATLGALFYVHLAGFYGWSLPWMLGGVVVAGLALRSIAGVWWFLSRQSFEELDFGLAEAASPGGEVPVSLRALARRPVRIRRAAARLTVESRAPGADFREIGRVERTLLQQRRLDSEERVEAEVALPVPEDAPYSFRSFGNERRIRCLVRMRVEAEPVAADGAPLDGTAAALTPCEQEIEVLIAPGD